MKVQLFILHYRSVKEGRGMSLNEVEIVLVEDSPNDAAKEIGFY